jgi:hypothetical protein
LDACLLILIPLADLLMAILAFFWEVRLTVTLRFPTRVFDAPALALADGSLADSPLRDRVRLGSRELGCPLQTQEWEK